MQIHKYIYLIVALVPWEMRENSFVILFSPRLSFHFWIHSSLCWAQLASPPWVIHKLQKQYSIWACMLRKRYRPNVSTTPITAMGCQQCLPLSIVHLKGKHCQKPHCCNGVVDTFGQLPQKRLDQNFLKKPQINANLLIIDGMYEF